MNSHNRDMFQILDKEGNADAKLVPDFSQDELIKIFRLMLFSRQVDVKSLKLQRQGRMGTFAPSLGHEACQVGSALAMDKNDWLFPYFRDLGAYITLGFPLENYFLYWMGHEGGMMIPKDLNIFPLSIPVASQLPHAVGAGMAAKIKGDKTAIICTFSDGATSEGNFHEALNFAGVYQTPNVFLCYNNQYAISMPRKKQTASHTLAQKAEAYGYEGILVDGNDVLAMYVTTRKALEKARSGGGPTLIEAYTYRISNHTTSDDAGKYRSEEETKKWEGRDPIKRFRAYLLNLGFWNQNLEKTLIEEIDGLMEKALQKAENTPLLSPEELFNFTYATMPPGLSEQLRELVSFLREKSR